MRIKVLTQYLAMRPATTFAKSVIKNAKLKTPICIELGKILRKLIENNTLVISLRRPILHSNF